MSTAGSAPGEKPAQNALASAMLMIAACALIAGTTLMAKGLGRGLGAEELHPLQISFGRYAFGFACLLPFALWRMPSFSGAPWALHLGRSLVGWAGVSCLFTAATYLPLADATAISFLNPLVAMVLAIPILGERVGPWRWGAAGIALIGALVLIQPGTEAFRPIALVALCAAFFMGLEAILVKRLSRSEPALRILILNNAAGALVAFCAASFVWTQPSPLQWGVMAILGGTMVCAQMLFLMAMHRAEASFAMPFFYATLVFAAAYDFAFFGELPAWTSWLGAALIVAGALVLAWREGRASRQNT